MSFLRAHAPPQPTPTPDDNNGCEGVGEHDEAQAEEMEVLSPLPSRQLDPASHVWPGVDARCTRLHKRCKLLRGRVGLGFRIGYGYDSSREILLLSTLLRHVARVMTVGSCLHETVICSQVPCLASHGFSATRRFARCASL